MSKGTRRPIADTPEPGMARRIETWLWTGPVGHLFGATLDFAEALLRYYRARVRAR